ncbi:hypothetical protein TIFTF001_054066 [Ficus carica]|uniref:Uncharacterized protein n=1 Tax=Ficus carica TaxID=3494 RepID=A0AA88EDW0_FICCA|nr:hypothetical protein TIFTF001_032431 [Ficus carica]GMN71275.1 hypothetical protein TIFTF001_054066 [Ficus carica]
MASLLLLLSELISHHNADPDFWIAQLPLSFSENSSSCASAFSSTARKPFMGENSNKWCELSEEMKMLQKSLHESRVSVDLVWP